MLERRIPALPPLLQHAPVAIACLDLEGRVLDVNRALLEASGYSRDQVQGLSFMTFLDPDDNMAASANFEALVSGARDYYTAERRYRRQNGEHRDVEVRVSLVRDAAGAPEMCLAVLQDITRRKRTEAALRQSEARYRALIEQAPFSIQIFSPDGRTLQVNEAWEHMWGMPADRVGDYNVLQDPQIAERGVMPLMRSAFDGQATRIPASLYDPNQNRSNASAHADAGRWVRGVIYPLKDDAGRVWEVVLMYEDITDQVHADEQRREATELREALLEQTQIAHRNVEAASRLKDEFLATLSHELRTPLNAILGWTRILRSQPFDAQTQRALDVIERNAAAQARLINDLLDVSRIITGKIRVQVDPVDLQTIAASALETVTPAAAAKGVRLDLRVPVPLPVITGDPQRLQQVFWNLLSNAVKFTDAGGAVCVTIERDGRSLVTTVQDSGAGIRAAILPFVFDRFTQGDSSSTRAHAGLGLGLAIVRHLVELHGGTVAAQSAGEGLGATFRVWLPVPQ